MLRRICANPIFGGHPDRIVSEFNKTFKKLGAIIIEAVRVRVGMNV
jgi:hypothetical protein